MQIIFWSSEISEMALHGTAALASRHKEAPIWQEPFTKIH